MPADETDDAVSKIDQRNLCEDSENAVASAQDPSEERNLLNAEPDVAEQYFDRLREMLADDDQRYVSGERVDDETRDHLEDLGYL
jgi:hypothetical protein